MTYPFFQACAAVLISVIVILSLRGQGREFGLLICIFVCCGLGVMAVKFLSPVLDFIKQLQNIGSIDGQMIGIIMKVVGVAIIAELCCLVCADAGNSAMGKGLQIAAVAVILWLSLPMFSALLDLIEGILGNL